jgi:hypothetical protein
MLNFIKTALGFIGGASSLYSVLATVAIGGGTVWYFYDKYVTTPIETAQKATKQCYTDYNKTNTIKSEALHQAGMVISEQGQKIYDLEHNRTSEQIDEDVKLIECEEKAKQLKWRLQHEKINISDKFFYTHLPF